jgi:peptide/nickel transport system permease protein
VEAGRAFGFSSFRIISKHILPNISGPVIVISASNFAAAILIEAGLSFLGLGAQPPQATWGKMISEHKGYIITGDAYLAILPGVAIFLLVLAFVLVGNGLRDAFDSKQLDTSVA